MYVHSAGHIQLNLINAIAFSPAELHAFSPAQLHTFNPAQVMIVCLAKYICDDAHDVYTFRQFVYKLLILPLELSTSTFFIGIFQISKLTLPLPINNNYYVLNLHTHGFI
jgi:hypothetical protein